MNMMSDRITVMKFGGTSVGNGGCMRSVSEIIASAARNGPTVAVVSAMSGVTNRLVAAAHKAATGDESAPDELGSQLHEQHRSALEELVADPGRSAWYRGEAKRIIDGTVSLVRGTALLRELAPRALDAISTAGERLSARLVASHIVEMGMEAEAVEATD